jgi:phospholipid/cholesterol/gamma-HCH transport system substrate-binding protein
MLHAIATQQQALRGAVDELPDTLTKAQRVLSQAAGVADAGTPVLRGIRPTTDNLSQISDELNTFANSATPALASLPPVLTKAKTLLDQARPAVRALRPGADALPGITHSARHLVGAVTPAMKTALDFIKYWAMSTNGRDALGNYFRAFVVTTPKSLLQIPGVGLPGAGGKAAASPSAAKTDNPATAAKGGTSGAAPQAGSAAASGGSATGLDSKQEGSLVDQLLGGQ